MSIQLRTIIMPFKAIYFSLADSAFKLNPSTSRQKMGTLQYVVQITQFPEVVCVPNVLPLEISSCFFS